MNHYPKPMREIIYEIISEAGECSIQKMYEKIRQKYPKIEINRNTVTTEMSDLAVNGPDSSLYPMQKRFLKRVRRGVYKLQKTS